MVNVNLVDFGLWLWGEISDLGQADEKSQEAVKKVKEEFGELLVKKLMTCLLSSRQNFRTVAPCLLHKKKNSSSPIKQRLPKNSRRATTAKARAAKEDWYSSLETRDSRLETLDSTGDWWMAVNRLNWLNTQNYKRTPHTTHCTLHTHTSWNLKLELETWNLKHHFSQYVLAIGSEH